MRRRAIDEVQVSTRKGLKKHCQNCLQAGHNTRSCKNPTNPRSKLAKGNSRGEDPVSARSENVPASGSIPRSDFSAGTQLESRSEDAHLPDPRPYEADATLGTQSSIVQGSQQSSSTATQSTITSRKEKENTSNI